ncbi:hypothetical protein [Candidatus Poriferisodalis sp.]|uniref:hypothetical protein n=1 Tax=Candidatus Poriferisodalis sp. TaxID=3101277 RepID=UPI003B01D72B
MNEPDPTESRAAYRLAYEEVVRWRAELDAQMDRIRTRSMAFFAVAVIAAGTGLAGFPTTKPPLASPSVLWMTVIGAGVFANLVAVLAVLRSPEGPFGDSPHALVAQGDDVDLFPTDDAVYRDLALWGDSNVQELYLQFNARRKWLYVSLAGVTAVLGALAALHWGRLFL